MESLRITWESGVDRKKTKLKWISFLDVEKITPGENSDRWKVNSNEIILKNLNMLLQRFKEKERKLGFEVDTQFKSYKFIIGNSYEWKLWLRGLLYAQNKAVVKRKRIGWLEDSVLKDLWLEADADNSGKEIEKRCIHFFLFREYAI